MNNHRCNVCKFLARYTGIESGEFTSMKCCRYPMAETVKDIDNHRCGELKVDYDELVDNHQQEKWRVERAILVLRDDHRKQVEKLRAKYRKLKKSIETHVKKGGLIWKK